MLRYVNSASPARCTPSPKRSPPRPTPSPPRGSQVRRSREERSLSRSVSPLGQPVASRSPSLHNSDADVSVFSSCFKLCTYTSALEDQLI